MSVRGQIPESFIQDVLQRVDVADIVGRHVSLRKAGINLLGLCPFHGEKSPSFTVSPTKQFYHCFGCGAHGDAIRFLMEHNGLGFVDAVTELAQLGGLRMPEATADPAEQARAAEARARRASLEEVLGQAATHYQARLKESERAIAYLKRRGLTGQVARRFGLGYAPEGWRSLASAFPRYEDSMLTEAGLVIVQGEDGAEQKRYDRFRDRIMFPIRSVKGEVIGFGGRVLDSGEPKYLNSPETPVFVKGRELYGLYEARNAIRDRGFVLVVEGYMDVVALAQSGIGNAVATLGTACTAEHVQKLVRFTDRVVFSFDGDAAGRRAAGRALEAVLPLASDLRSFRFLFLPSEHDPDSYVREHGTEAFGRLADAATPLSQQLVEHAAQGTERDTAEGRARLLAQARPLWEQLPPGALRGQILASLAQAAGLGTADLTALWGAGGAAGAAAGAGAGRSGAAGAPADRGAAGGGPRRRGAAPAGPADRLRRPPVVTAARQPADHVARMLLLHAGWWLELPGSEQEMLAGLESWHGALFRWLERDLTEHGPREWPELRALVTEEPFAEAARALVDDAPVALPPERDELRQAVAQTARALAQRETLRVLGRLG